MSGITRSFEPLFTPFNQFIDGVVSAGLLWLLHYIYLGGQLGPDYQIALLLVFFLIPIFFNFFGVYRSWRGVGLFNEFKVVCSACFVVYLLLLLLGWGGKVTHEYSRLLFGMWMLALPLVLMLYRFILRKFLRTMRKHGYNSRTAVIVGADEIGQDLCKWIKRNRWTGIRIQGVFDDNATISVDGIPVLGSVDGAEEYIRENNPDMAFVALPMSQEQKIKQTIETLSDTTTSVYMIPDIFCFDLMISGKIAYMGGIPAISLWDSPFYGLSSLLKAISDFFLASVILLIISPIMLVISVLIKLDSKGPVLFSQWRYGLNGQSIRVYKFRTMKVCQDGFDFVQQARKEDPRITRIGKILRRTSLDELPQFINVLQGRMSVVGPRPHAVSHNEEYRSQIKGYMLRHKIKPGITGLAQINGYRGETDTLDKMEKRVLYDLEYLRNWSLSLDLKIVLKTIVNGFIGKNAY